MWNKNFMDYLFDLRKVAAYIDICAHFRIFSYFTQSSRKSAVQGHKAGRSMKLVGSPNGPRREFFLIGSVSGFLLRFDFLVLKRAIFSFYFGVQSCRWSA